MVFVSAGYPAKHTYGIKLGGAGDVSKTQTVVWSYEKGSAYVPSPILYGDYFYLTTDRGVLTCIEAKTGAVKYEGGRIPVPATFTASPVAFEGKILLTSEDGDTYVIKAGPVHEILRTNSLGEPVYREGAGRETECSPQVNWSLFEGVRPGARSSGSEDGKSWPPPGVRLDHIS
jgi:hypothetical protein